MSQPEAAPTLELPPEQLRNIAQMLTYSASALRRWNQRQQERDRQGARAAARQVGAAERALEEAGAPTGDGLPRPLDQATDNWVRGQAEQKAEQKQPSRRWADKQYMPELDRWAVYGQAPDLPAGQQNLGIDVPTKFHADVMIAYWEDPQSPVEDLAACIRTPNPIKLDSEGQRQRQLARDPRAREGREKKPVLASVADDLDMNKPVDRAVAERLRGIDPEIDVVLQERAGAAQQQISSAFSTAPQAGQQTSGAQPEAASSAGPEPVPGEQTASAQRGAEEVAAPGAMATSSENARPAPVFVADTADAGLSDAELVTRYPARDPFRTGRFTLPGSTEALTGEGLNDYVRANASQWDPENADDCHRAGALWDALESDGQTALADRFPGIGRAMEVQSTVSGVGHTEAVTQAQKTQTGEPSRGHAAWQGGAAHTAPEGAAVTGSSEAPEWLKKNKSQQPQQPQQRPHER